MTILDRLLPNNRAIIAFVHDIIMVAVAFLISLALRLGFTIDPFHARVLIPGTMLFVASAVFVFLGFRLYRGIWRYASINDLLALARAVTVLMILFSVLAFFVFNLEGLPRSVPLIDWFVLLAMMGGPRFAYRLFKDQRFRARIIAQADPKIPVLLVGAGDEAELFIRALQRTDQTAYKPVGIVSETRARVGKFIHDVAVLGTLDDIETVVARLKGTTRPQRLVLTKDTFKGAEVRDLLKTAERLGLTLSRMPKVHDLKSGATDEVRVRPIAIEDLLGRPQQPLDRAAMSTLIQGKRVLVTGAGGSIGSELARQIASLEPAELVLVENSEYALYQIDLEMVELAPSLARHAVLADVRKRSRLDQVFNRYKPELVFHAAALKHVPLVEDNPFEGLLTNALGTRNIADACEAAKVSVMVMISTDKAVNPTNIMGATKRIAETYVQALDLRRGDQLGTKFVTVRFGNVLGSTGSVVPLFQRQLNAGGPLTVTHPDMTRYFMTIREAVELVLQASSLGLDNTANAGKIFVLDMGEPIKIVELARQMIRLANLKPDEDIQIQFTGTRPGEKLFEEIFHGSEPLVQTQAPGILLASPRTQDLNQVLGILEALKIACEEEDWAGLLHNIAALVPEYAPPENDIGS